MAWKEYKDVIGMSRKHVTPNPPKLKSGSHRKLGVISDTHGDVYKSGLENMLAEKPDLVFIVGDVLDAFSLSSFTKSKDIPIEIELANTRAMFERISSVCPLKVSKGNHDRRFLIYLSNHIDSKYIKFINTDLLTLTANGIVNCEIVDDSQAFTTPGGERFGGLSTSFMITAGDAVFTHAESSRKGELNTARAVYDWYSAWKKPMGWIEPRLIGQAHVHRAALGYAQGGHLLIMELGAMLNPAWIQYAMDGDTKWTPPTIGYSVIEQDLVNKEWKTDFTKVRFVPC